MGHDLSRVWDERGEEPWRRDGLGEEAVGSIDKLGGLVPHFTLRGRSGSLPRQALSDL